MNMIAYIVSPVAALLLSPLLVGIINKTKAAFAGRQGQPLLQAYYDLCRLFRKGVVYSKTTTWVFRVAPIIIFCSTLAATCFVPFVATGSQFSFLGDVVLLLYLLGFARFFLILSALDTGSAFEGMGASREAFFSALAEPVTFICILNIMRANATGSVVTALSLPMTPSILALLVAIPLFLILLAENSRIPFDDPNTHLELTMIHEVMILDNSGPGLALLEYAAAMKLWLFSLVLGRVLLPVSSSHPVAQVVLLLGLMIAIAVAVGVVESVTARVRLLKVPQLLFSAFVLALLGFFLSVNGVFA
ncbi:MAG: NADH-quinone oxidoreductase subunit H [bacterium]